jgi:DNA-binding CsgD family transcriptional regulator
VAVSEAQVERARLLFMDVVVDPELWPAALKFLAEICGGTSAQLIARDKQDQPLLNWVTNIDSETIAFAEKCGLGDVKANPRLQIGRYARPLIPVADQDSVHPDARRKSRIYADFFDKYDMSFNCQAVLHRSDELLLRTSVSKSSGQGPFDSEELRVFSALLPYVQAAARHQAFAERRAVEGLLAEGEAAGRAVFILNRSGLVIGASSAGEAELRLGRFVTSAHQRLKATHPAGNDELQRALGSALAVWHGGLYAPPLTIMLSGQEPSRVMQLEVTALPFRPHSLAGEPAAVITLRKPKSSFLAETVQRQFGLTDAEAQIALSLANGASLAEIAVNRSVSVATVRVQLKSIFAKAHVHRQSELVALIK